MGPTLIILLALQLFYTTTLSKVLNVPQYAVNSINNKLTDYSLLLPSKLSNENYELSDDEDDLSLADVSDDDVPVVRTVDDRTELRFRQPIESMNIDYLRNAIVLKFHKNNAKLMMKLNLMENEKKKTVQDNFIRFGKRSYEEFPLINSFDERFIDTNPGMRLERSHQNSRDARGDNFMRFGRSVNTKNDFMRFGRGANDFMRFGRSPSQDFMRLGRSSGKNNFMRFGRADGKDFMRFGRDPGQDFMRFGRDPGQDFMRFGRAGQDGFMRFGRNPHQDFMRFDPNSSPKIPVNSNFMRYSRPDNFMRFGRTPPQPSNNFIRFGKSKEKSNEKNTSQAPRGKNELKQAVKLIHEADKNSDNENPVDKAIKVLFDKHQQQDQNDNIHSDELNGESSSHYNDNNDLDSESDYFLKMSK